MLQAHSFLWHYLWVAPNVLFLFLGFVLWRRKLTQQFPAFVAFAIIGSISELAVYTADVVPRVSAQTFWRVDWASLLAEGILKFAVIGEIFAHVLGPYSSLARLGKSSIRAVGVILVLVAALAAAYAPKDSVFGIVSGAHLLEQTTYLIESGLLVFIVGLAFYFRLSFGRALFGITIGLSFSACVHLASWAIVANAGLPDQTRSLFDLFRMATYHACVLLWFYYLLGPGKVTTKSTVPLPENTLDVWNRELERLVHP
jgi:hypothetical protein